MILVVIVIAGVVVAVATLPPNQLALATETLVTVPHEVVAIYLSHVASEESATS